VRAGTKLVDRWHLRWISEFGQRTQRSGMSRSLDRHETRVDRHAQQGHGYEEGKEAAGEREEGECTEGNGG